MNYVEIEDALKKVIEARADINCCVNFDEDDLQNARYLYYQCRIYMEEYKKFKKRMGQ